MITTCALIDVTKGIVDNMIIADPSDYEVLDGFMLLPNPPSFAQPGTVWNGTKLLDPSAVELPQIKGVRTV